jgi:DNA-binding NtrC family response regulator
MPYGTVALLGNLNIDRAVFDGVAAEYGWSVIQAENLQVLKDISGTRDVVAVLFDASCLGLSWQDGLERVLESSPRALPIACAGFSEVIPWPEMAEAGAFHELRRPIEASEVRTSLGFVWAAKRQDAPLVRAVGSQSRDVPSVKSANSSGKSFGAVSIF